jgi:arginase
VTQTTSTVSTLAKRVALLGVPVDLGAAQRGTLMGPAALRTAGMLPTLQSLGLAVEDHGDISLDGIPDCDDPPPANARQYREIQRWTRAVSAQAYRLAGSGAIPLFLGGDHTLAMGSVNGVARYWQQRGREPFALWLDAHADYNTPVTTVTGNMHGMSAAFLCGEAGLDRLLGDEPRATLDPRRLELFGIRAIDRLERQLVQQRRIGIADMRRIDEFGVGVLMREVI